jgi:hypothetical protein
MPELPLGTNARQRGKSATRRATFPHLSTPVVPPATAVAIDGEFQFRWNNREAESMFMPVVAALVIGQALQYAALIGKMSIDSGSK